MFTAVAGVNNFAARIRTLRRFHLLAAEGPGELAAFVEHAFFGTQLNGVLTTVLHDAGIGGIPLDRMTCSIAM